MIKKDFILICDVCVICGKYLFMNSLNRLSSYLYSNKNYIYGVNCYRYEASYKSFNSGIPEITANSSLILYPNPSNGSVRLQYQLPKNEKDGELILYNLQGAEQKRYKIDNTFKDILLDNTQLPAGTYFTSCKQKEVHWVQKRWWL